MISKISDSVVCITEEDMDLDLFESRYPIPDGVTYNSYVILDDKVAVLDTADECVTDAWLADLKTVLNGRSVDYLVIHHMEPDHAANIATLADMYPDMKLVGNDMIFRMVTQFFGIDYSDRSIVMEEGGVLELGKHSLRFVMAPLVHWPEVMMSYEQSDRLLFTADGFGRFGPADPSYD
ncbi:MAG: FprA family A-type flavoprotein [Candidatus Methanomethylophilaceae archaeon]